MVAGDVSFNNNNRGRSALVDAVVLGNLNVHVENFAGVRWDVFGDLNINRARSVLSSVGYGQNVNIHGAPTFCQSLNAFVDADSDQRVCAQERSALDSCPAGTMIPAFDFSAVFDETGLDVQIVGGSGSYRFGMVDTGAVLPGWAGEDCLMGAPGFNLRHDSVGWTQRGRARLYHLVRSLCRGRHHLRRVRRKPVLHQGQRPVVLPQLYAALASSRAQRSLSTQSSSTFTKPSLYARFLDAGLLSTAPQTAILP